MEDDDVARLLAVSALSAARRRALGGRDRATLGILFADPPRSRAPPAARSSLHASANITDMRALQTLSVECARRRLLLCVTPTVCLQKQVLLGKGELCENNPWRYHSENSRCVGAIRTRPTLSSLAARATRTMPSPRTPGDQPAAMNPRRAMVSLYSLGLPVMAPGTARLLASTSEARARRPRDITHRLDAVRLFARWASCRESRRGRADGNPKAASQCTDDDDETDARRRSTNWVARERSTTKHLLVLVARASRA